MRLIITIAIAVLGCKGRDDCERFLDRMPREPRTKEALADCRRHIDQLRKDPTARCLLESDTDEAAATCLLDVASAAAKESEAVAKAADALTEARKKAAEARDQLEKAERALDELSGKVDKAIDAIASAQNDADRANEKAELGRLQREMSEVQDRIKADKQAAEDAERNIRVRVSK
jgi:chromosome segregation ATPase